MATRLTTTAIENAKPKPHPYEIHDAKQPGLLLRVQPSGIKSFVVTWKRGRRVTLKPRYPSLTLEHARTQARAALTEADKDGAPANWRPKTKVDAAAEVRTFGDFLDHRYAHAIAHCKAHKATIANIKAQFPDLLDKPLASITTWHFTKFISTRLKAKIAPATINRDLDRVRAAFNVAIDLKLLTSNPVAGVSRLEVDNKRVRYLSDDEEKRLRKALADRERERRKHRSTANTRLKQRHNEPRRLWTKDEFTDHLAPVVLLAINTGLRRSELLALTWNNINLDRRQITVTGESAKSGKTRYLPLNAEALDVLTRWKRQGTGTGPVFPGANGAQLTSTKKAWLNLLQSAELSDFHYHDLRHHFASRLVMEGVDLYTVQQLLGHADFEMTQRYAHLTPEHRLAAVEKLVSKR